MFLLNSSELRHWFVDQAKSKSLGRSSVAFVFTDHRESSRLERLASALRSSGFDCDPIEYDGDGEAYVTVHPQSIMDEAGILNTNTSFREMAGKYRIEYLGVRITE